MKTTSSRDPNEIMSEIRKVPNKRFYINEYSTNEDDTLSKPVRIEQDAASCVDA